MKSKRAALLGASIAALAGLFLVSAPAAHAQSLPRPCIPSGAWVNGVFVDGHTLCANDLNNNNATILKGALVPSNNLSDLTNKPQAVLNLGLAPIGTSGASFCLLTASCTQSGHMTFTGGVTMQAADVTNALGYTPAQATALYVSNSATNGFAVGSDSNVGTYNSPLLTLGKALSIAAPGQRIVGNCGTYTPATSSKFLIAQSQSIEGLYGTSLSSPTCVTLRAASGQTTIMEVTGNGVTLNLTGVTFDGQSAATNSLLIDNSTVADVINLTGVLFYNAGTNGLSEGSAGRFGLSALNTGCVGSFSGSCFDINTHAGGNISINGVAAAITNPSTTSKAGAVLDFDGEASGIGVTISNVSGSAAFSASSTQENPVIRILNANAPQVLNMGVAYAANTHTGNPQLWPWGSYFTTTGGGSSGCVPILISTDSSAPIETDNALVQGNWVNQDCMPGGGHGLVLINQDGDPGAASGRRDMVNHARIFGNRVTAGPDETAAANQEDILCGWVTDCWIAGNLTEGWPGLLNAGYGPLQKGATGGLVFGNLTLNPPHTGFMNKGGAEKNGGVGPSFTNNTTVYNVAPTPVSSAVTSGSYNSTTGLVTLNFATTSFTYTNGSAINVSGLTGSGSLSSLQGAFTTATLTPTSLTYTAATGLGSITITGGTFAPNIVSTAMVQETDEACYPATGWVSNNNNVVNLVTTAGLAVRYNFQTQAGSSSPPSPNICSGGVGPNGNTGTFANNNYYGVITGTGWVAWNGTATTNYSTLAAWQAAIESSALGVNPLLTSDFKLGPGSPLIAAGTATPTNATTDMTGAPFVNPTPSIGAFQYTGPGAASAPPQTSVQNTWSATQAFAGTSWPTFATNNLYFSGNAGTPTFAANSEGACWTVSTRGLTCSGQGSASDVTFQSSAGTIAFSMATGTGNITLSTPTTVNSTLTVASSTGLTLSNASATLTTPNLKVTNLLISGTAPTIGSGFGTSPSVSAQANGTAAFTVNVGTGGSATSGVLTMPAAAHGWACFASDQTTPGANFTKQSANTTTSVTLTNYNSAGTATAWAASDTLIVNCQAY